MIKSFKSKETQQIFNREKSKRLPTDLQRIALRKLRMLNRAVNLQDLKVPPGNHLELLVGDRKGQYCIRINEKWRICFTWAETDAFEVEIVDYH
jgi:toxin HigB-1